MKSIFKLNIDISSIKGAIGSISSLRENAKHLKSELGSITDGLLKNSPKSLIAISKMRMAIDKLKGSVTNVTNSFRNMGMTVRGIVTNAFSKLTSVFKTTLMSLGALVGGATGLFNVANGSNRTQTSAALAGLSWAEQKALDDANTEIGFNADFATNRAGFNQGEETIAAQALLNNRVLTSEEFNNLRNDSMSYYKLNDKLYEEYKKIRESSAREDLADATFKKTYGNVLQQFGYGDFATFKLANQNGVIARHKQTFGDTLSAYSGVDAEALQKGERALNQFSETLKAFALGVAAKFLPGLTKGLKSLTGLFSKLSDYTAESGLLTEISGAVGSLVELIITSGEAIIGIVSKLMGGDTVEYIKDIFGSASSFFKGTTAWIKGDKEARDRHYQESKEKRDKAHEKNKNAAGNIIEGAVTALTGNEGYGEKAKDFAKTSIDALRASSTGLVESTAKDIVKGVENSDKKGLIPSLGDYSGQKVEQLKDYIGVDEMKSKAKEIYNKVTMPFNIYLGGNQVKSQTVTFEQQIDSQGRINSQRITQ